MISNILDSFFETLSSELDQRIEQAAGKRLTFALTAIDSEQRAAYVLTNSTPEYVLKLADALREHAQQAAMPPTMN